MRYVLTRPQYVRPPNLSAGEAEVVYLCLEADGGKPKSFAELVVEAKHRRLPSHFKRPDSTTIEKSLRYWLSLFLERNGYKLSIDRSGARIKFHEGPNATRPGALFPRVLRIRDGR